MNKFVAIVTRTLKPGKTYEDYRNSWYHKNGFGIPTTMYTVINTANPREIISIGILDGELKELFESMQIDLKERQNSPLDEVVESSMIRTFGIVAAVDDFSAKGKLAYTEPKVDNKPTDYNEITTVINQIAIELNKANAKREEIRKNKASSN